MDWATCCSAGTNLCMRKFVVFEISTCIVKQSQTEIWGKGKNKVGGRGKEASGELQ